VEHQCLQIAGTQVKIDAEPREREPTPESAARQATSRKTREVAHPQLFRSMLKDKPALYLPVKVAHPPCIL
jgi:hypothetical protein